MFYRLDQKDLPKINLINLVSVHPPYIHSKRQLDEYVMYVIVKGEMFIREDNVDYHLKENDLIILSPEYEHEGYKSSDCEYYYIHFNSNMIFDKKKGDLRDGLLRRRFESLRSNMDGFGIRKYDILLPKYHCFKNESSIAEIVRVIRDIITYSRDRREYFATKADCMLMELFIDISREYTSEILFEAKATSTKSSRKVFELLNYFNIAYMEDISGDYIEDKFACNFDYINRIFKQATGKTIFNYLNELRVLKAKEFLESGFHTISEVADLTGFNDAYYFSKVFKKYAGITPGRYGRIKKQQSGS